MKVKKNKYIVFDFNGTLLDDLDLGVSILNRLCEVYHVNAHFTKEEYQEVFDFPIIDYYAKVGFDVSVYDDIALNYVKLYEEGFKKLKISSERIKTLEYLKNKGYHLVILSATSHEQLLKQTEKLNISQYFDEILGINDIYASSKAFVAKKFYEEHKDDELYFIGDTLHDLEVSNIMKAKCYLVSSGHVSKRRLLEGYDLVKDNVEEVIKCLELDNQATFID